MPDYQVQEILEVTLSKHAFFGPLKRQFELVGVRCLFLTQIRNHNMLRNAGIIVKIESC